MMGGGKALRRGGPLPCASTRRQGARLQEARSPAHVILSPLSRARQTATKKNPYGRPAAPTATVGVLGAGLMGAGIAQVTAAAGTGVVLKDRDAAAVARGEKQISANLQGAVKKRRMTQFDKDRVLSRVIGVGDGDASWRTHLGRADVVVEAVFEDLGLKHRVIKEIEPLLRPDAVFASNTSALPIASIATAAAVPSRVLGMHYFSPVDKMVRVRGGCAGLGALPPPPPRGRGSRHVRPSPPALQPLLEIIPHAGTSPAALAKAYDLGLRQGKTVIVVKDVPGFYVNRALAPWATEALLLVEQGVSPEALDKAVRAFGYPVGPVTLADEVRARARAPQRERRRMGGRLSAVQCFSIGTGTAAAAAAAGRSALTSSRTRMRR